MHVIYATEPFPTTVTKSIFLAGPTPRSPDVPSWRPQALRLFADLHYDGVVFVPEARDGDLRWSYEAQIQWEDEALNRADCILFWVPRDMQTLPGLTTNHEFGEWFKSGKVVLGAPEDAPHLDYLRFKATEWRVPQATTLTEALQKATLMVGAGMLRTGGECQVPLHIWRTPSFEAWYQAQKAAGNRLDSARVLWTFRAGPAKMTVFCWVLHVNVWIAKEGRAKTNEFVLARPDIATVVLYQRGPTVLDGAVVLIREFRSPAATADGFVWELPGGSSFKPTGDTLSLAADEVREETGLTINSRRVRVHDSRQLVATLSAHKAHLFSVEITDDELAWFRSQAGVPHGVLGDSERTYVEIRTVREILREGLVDWSMLGMILSILESS